MAVYIYIYLEPGDVLYLGSNTRSFPIKTRVIWVSGIYIYTVYIHIIHRFRWLRGTAGESSVRDHSLRSFIDFKEYAEPKSPIFWKS